MTDYRKPAWRDRFELTPGKWVFVPDEGTKEFGRGLALAIRKRWTPPANFVHLHAGGHVKAVRQGCVDTSFARLDLKSFFGSITKSRVTRNLSVLFGDYAFARQAAVMSTVPDPVSQSGFVLPFGFVQSPIVASLCLANSKLGRALRELDEAVRAFVYVDDIFISTSEPMATLESAFATLREAATASGFVVNEQKSKPPATSSAIFNIEVSNSTLAVTSDRMMKFRDAVVGSPNTEKSASIVAYVASVNSAQAEELSSL